MREIIEKEAGKLKASKYRAYPSLPEGVGKLKISAYCLPACGLPILSIRKIGKVFSRFEGEKCVPWDTKS